MAAEGGGQAADQPVDERGRRGAAFRFLAGARLVPPLRGRWVVATVPTTVPAAPPATGVTPVRGPTTPSSACGGIRSVTAAADHKLRVGGQRRGWQVGQWVVPRASMTLRRSSVPQRSHGSPARP